MNADIKDFLGKVEDRLPLYQQYPKNPNIEKMVDAYNTVAIRNGRMKMLSGKMIGEEAKSLINELYSHDIERVNQEFYRYLHKSTEISIREFLIKTGTLMFFIAFSVTLFLIVRHAVITDIDPTDSMLSKLFEYLIEFIKLH